MITIQFRLGVRGIFIKIHQFQYQSSGYISHVREIVETNAENCTSSKKKMKEEICMKEMKTKIEMSEIDAEQDKESTQECEKKTERKRVVYKNEY